MKYIKISKIDNEKMIKLKNDTVMFIYPNQLFKNNKLIKYCDHVYIIEDSSFFIKYKYHKLKLILHRSSMKSYYDFLINKYSSINQKISYIEYDIEYDEIYKNIKKKYKNIILYDPCDIDIINRLNNLSNKYLINIFFFDTKIFIESIDDLIIFRNTQTNKINYHHDVFYKWQRIRLNILVEDNLPLFGKWSFDNKNRNKFDNNYITPSEPKCNYNNYVIEAIQYIKKKFNDNFGIITDDNFIYPINHNQAEIFFINFLNEKLSTFGKYQDASSNEIKFGSHSLLSILLNIGLITVKKVLNKTLKYFNNLNNDEKKIIINSVEGFIRQIIGWRSYVRFIYIFHGKKMLKMNKLNHQNKITKKWYDAKTNILPIDNLILKVEKCAYLHHIERLMYIGNFALLCKIKPLEIYKWFMICFIDSFEWVMVANVMGMSQYSIENITMMSRPYFSSSNYILKMSNYKKDRWSIIWDCLYYNFINDNSNILSKIYAVAPGVKHWNNKTKKNKMIFLMLQCHI